MDDLLIRCHACGSLLDQEDLFCANCGASPPSPQEREPGEDETFYVIGPGGDPVVVAKSAEGPPLLDKDTSRESVHNFECNGCGASMSYDAGAGDLRCPFCGSTDMHGAADARILAPDAVVPMRLSHDDVLQRLGHHLRGGFFRPKELARQSVVVEIRPVYVPYWVFRGRTHTYWTADTSQTPPGARGDWYPLAGEHRSTYQGVLIGASGVLTPSETASICPFDLAAAVPPEAVDLHNVTVERFSVPRKYARPIALQTFQEFERQACDARYVPGRSRNVHANTVVDSMSSRPVLLPVWVLAYRWQERLFRVLVNGQTGKTAGDVPTSYVKLLMVLGIIFGAILAIILLVSLIGGIASSVSRLDEGFSRSVPSAVAACDGGESARSQLAGCASAGKVSIGREGEAPAEP